jgi:hypothetical protein
MFGLVRDEDQARYEVFMIDISLPDRVLTGTGKCG